WAGVPVPSSTTFFIICVICAAVVGDITCDITEGLYVCTVRPSWSTALVARRGVISLPPLATAAATIAICSGVTARPPVPMPIRPMSCRGLAGGYGRRDGE